MQMKLLESWVGMERPHLQAITAIKECLHSVVCRVPLLEGARVRNLVQWKAENLYHIRSDRKSILTELNLILTGEHAINICCSTACS